MQKRGRIVLLAVVLGLGTLLLIALWPSREPSYEGKPLSSWVDTLIDIGLPITLTGTEHEEVVREAILKMGTTNAIPLLLKWAFEASPVHIRILGAFPVQLRD